MSLLYVKSSPWETARIHAVRQVYDINKYFFQNTSLPQLMVIAESFNWNYLDAASYTSVVEWFLTNCDPKCILAERTSNAAKVLRYRNTATYFFSGLN